MTPAETRAARIAELEALCMAAVRSRSNCDRQHNDRLCPASALAAFSAVAHDLAAKAEIRELQSARIDVDGSAPELRPLAAAQAAVALAKSEALDEALDTILTMAKGVGH